MAGVGMALGGLVVGPDCLLIAYQCTRTHLPHRLSSFVRLRYGSPPHTIPFNPTSEGSTRVSMTWRAISVRHYLVEPSERFSPVHGQRMENWLWSVGHHPFGPFGNCSTLSAALADVVGRCRLTPG